MGLVGLSLVFLFRRSYSVLFTAVSSQDCVRDITLFKRSHRTKCSLLVHPVLEEIKCKKLYVPAKTIARFFIQMKEVLPMASGVIIID